MLQASCTRERCRCSAATAKGTNVSAMRRPGDSHWGVEFIDENGGGPGVRLRKHAKEKPRK